MQSIRITSRLPSRKGKRNQLSKSRRTSTKVIPIEKTQAGVDILLNLIGLVKTKSDFIVRSVETGLGR